MTPQSLQFKVSLYLTLVLGAAMLLFVFLFVRQERAEQLRSMVNHMSQLSQVIERSTRHAMLLDQPDFVDKIIEDIAKQEGIRRVRVLRKNGTIAHSNFPGEIGQHIDKDAEHCSQCHAGKKVLSDTGHAVKWWIFETPEHQQLLGNMEVIRNEQSCAGASCHAPPAAQPVLGVVDITYSLDEINQTMRAHLVKMATVSIGFVLLVSISVGWLLRRLIYRPLGDLARGAERIAAGDFDHPIPVRGEDEFGILARSTNSMMAAVKKSTQELEEKVKERTEELRLAEAEVARGEKLAAIGQLAAGIAHELNNPLTGVLTFTSLMRQKMPAASQDAEDLDLVIRETRRCASIIRRLLDFAREKPPEKTEVNLNELALETVRFVERSAALQQVEIVVDADPALPLVHADADLIKQVLMNILVNAQQAIAGRGRITLRTRLHPARRLPLRNDAQPVAEIAVTDTGCGIDKANLQRIFDPFFTSKEVGKGTGLGLSVSYGIVKAHGGVIEVESTVGAGSTFRVLLPASLPVPQPEHGTSETTA